MEKQEKEEESSLPDLTSGLNLASKEGDGNTNKWLLGEAEEGATEDLMYINHLKVSDK